jgi:hypothetical protein
MSGRPSTAAFADADVSSASPRTPPKSVRMQNAPEIDEDAVPRAASPTGSRRAAGTSVSQKLLEASSSSTAAVSMSAPVAREEPSAHASRRASNASVGSVGSTSAPDADSYRREIEASRARKAALVSRGPVSRRLMALAASDDAPAIVELPSGMKANKTPAKRLPFRGLAAKTESDGEGPGGGRWSGASSPVGASGDNSSTVSADDLDDGIAAGAGLLASPAQMFMNIGPGAIAGAVSPAPAPRSGLVPIQLELSVSPGRLAREPPAVVPPPPPTLPPPPPVMVERVVTKTVTVTAPDPALEAEIARLRRDLGEAESKLASERAHSRAVEEALAAANARADSASARIQAADARATAAERRVGALERTLSDERSKAASGESVAETQRRRADEAESAWERAEKRAEAAERALANERGRADAAEAAHRAMQRQLEDADSQLQRERARAEHSENRCKAAEDALKRAEEAARKASSETRAAESRLALESDSRVRAEERAGLFEGRAHLAEETAGKAEAALRKAAADARAAEARLAAESDARAHAEERAHAEAQARSAAEQKLRAEADARLKAEARASAEAEARARAEHDAKARAEADLRARKEAERAAADASKTSAEIAFESQLSKIRSSLAEKERELALAHEAAADSHRQLALMRELVDKARAAADAERARATMAISEAERERARLLAAVEKERAGLSAQGVSERAKLAEQVDRERARTAAAEAALETARHDRASAIAALEAERGKSAAALASAEAREGAARKRVSALEGEVASLEEELSSARRRIVQLQAQLAAAMAAAAATPSIPDGSTLLKLSADSQRRRAASASRRGPVRTKEVVSITLEEVARRKAAEEAAEKEKRSKEVVYPVPHPRSAGGGSSLAGSEAGAPAWDGKTALPPPPAPISIEEYHAELAAHRKSVKEYEQRVSRLTAATAEARESSRLAREEVLQLRAELESVGSDLLRVDAIAVSAGERLADVTASYAQAQQLISVLRSHINELEGGSCVHGLSFPGFQSASAHASGRPHSPSHARTGAAVASPSAPRMMSPERALVAQESSARSVSPVRVPTSSLPAGLAPPSMSSSGFHVSGSVGGGQASYDDAGAAEHAQSSDPFFSTLASATTTTTFAPSPVLSPGLTRPRPARSLSPTALGHIAGVLETKKPEESHPLGFGARSPRLPETKNAEGRSSSPRRSPRRTSPRKSPRAPSSSSTFEARSLSDYSPSLVTRGTLSPVALHTAAGTVFSSAPPSHRVADVPFHTSPSPSPRNVASPSARSGRVPSPSPTRIPRSRLEGLSPQAAAIASLAAAVSPGERSPAVLHVQQVAARAVLDSIAGADLRVAAARLEAKASSDEAAAAREEAARVLDAAIGGGVGGLDAGATEYAFPFPAMSITPSASPLPDAEDGHVRPSPVRSALRGAHDVFSHGLHVPAFGSSAPGHDVGSPHDHSHHHHHHHRDATDDPLSFGSSAEQQTQHATGGAYGAHDMTEAPHSIPAVRISVDSNAAGAGAGKGGKRIGKIAAPRRYSITRRSASSPPGARGGQAAAGLSSPGGDSAFPLSADTELPQGRSAAAVSHPHQHAAHAAPSSSSTTFNLFPSGVGSVIALAAGKRPVHSASGPSLGRAGVRVRAGPVVADASALSSATASELGKELVSAFHPAAHLHGAHTSYARHASSSTPSRSATRSGSSGPRDSPAPVRATSASRPRAAASSLTTAAATAHAPAPAHAHAPASQLPAPPAPSGNLLHMVSMSNSSSTALLAAPDGRRPLVLVRPLSGWRSPHRRGGAGVLYAHPTGVPVAVSPRSSPSASPPPHPERSPRVISAGSPRTMGATGSGMAGEGMVGGGWTAV